MDEKKITIRCPACGKTKLIDRDESDPAEAVVCETPCPKCAESGGFPEMIYYDENEYEVFQQ